MTRVSQLGSEFNVKATNSLAAPRVWRYVLLGICVVCSVVLSVYFPKTPAQLIVWLCVGLVGLSAVASLIRSERRRARAGRDPE